VVTIEKGADLDIT
jgi:hypothetical protein